MRIWYQNRFATTDAALAGSLMTAMETTIWPSLTTLMQQEPTPDGGSTESCSGGSDAVDIALVDGLAKATTYASGLSQEATSAKMIFPRAGSGGTTPYLAHEFMHMIQYAFSFSSGNMSSGENAWLKEGTAQWVQDYASSIGLTPDQTEHRRSAVLLPLPREVARLDQPEPPRLRLLPVLALGGPQGQRPDAGPAGLERRRLAEEPERGQVAVRRRLGPGLEGLHEGELE